MSATRVAPTEVERPVAAPPMRHFKCDCNPTTCYCGARARSTAIDRTSQVLPECVVCLDLWNQLRACPRCGLDPEAARKVFAC